MATFATKSVRREGVLYVDFPENILIVPELNGRVEHTEIETLAADIAANGQRTPVLIRKNDAGQPVLVYGHRRWRAVKLINDKKKPGEQKTKLICTYESLTDEEAFKAAISENRFRSDLTPMDDCHNINLMVKRFKSTLEEVAGIYFPEATKPEAKAEALRWVKDRASLVELAPEAAQAVREGKASITAAVELTKLSKDQQRKVITETASKVKGKARIKVEDVKKHKPAPVPRKPVASAVSDLSPAKVERIINAAEELACAVDLFFEDATEETNAENKMTDALNAFRKLVPVPFVRAEGKAA